MYTYYSLFDGLVMQHHYRCGILFWVEGRQRTGEFEVGGFVIVELSADVR